MIGENFKNLKNYLIEFEAIISVQTKVNKFSYI